MAIGFAIIVGVGVTLFLLIFLAYVIGTYNSLIRLRNNIDKSWANIDVLLKQRADELPNIIASVKGYMDHERELFESITNARSAMMNAKTMEDKANADYMISGALKTLFAVAENYPTLKANENFMQLQQRITGLENEIADRREFYNDSVNTYNIRIESFPEMIVAGLLHFDRREMFQAIESERQNVKMKF